MRYARAKDIYDFTHVPAGDWVEVEEVERINGIYKVADESLPKKDYSDLDHYAFNVQAQLNNLLQEIENIKKGD